MALPIFGVGSGCAPAPDQVELRLYPCELGGEQPRAVVVEITGYDASGEIIEVFEVGFDNLDTSVFDDGYATVGYHSDPSVVSADIRLGWFAEVSAGGIDEADTQTSIGMVSVPAHGEVLELGDGSSGDCLEIAGDGDGDTSGDGDGDGDGDTGDGDGDPSGDGDGDGDTSGDGDGDTSGDGDGDTSGDGDGDTSGDGDGDDGLPMVGDACDPLPYPVHCIPEPDGMAGTPLLCNGVSEQLVEYDDFASEACSDMLCPVGSSMPVQACAGVGTPSYCLCQPNTAEDCGDATLGCDGDDNIRLCFGGQVVVAQCPNCTMEGEYYACDPF